MTFKNTFCPSTWFHMRINNAGQYEYCRWAYRDNERVSSIQQQSPVEFFQKTLAPIRSTFIDGCMPGPCENCKIMENHGKVSGRQRQLLKVGVKLDYFTESFLSSPWISEFKYSAEHEGQTTQAPQDWQIDLGNHCNNACVFCSPKSSSRIATEYVKLEIIDRLPPPSWCDDPVLLEKFLHTLKNSPNLRFLHFIGGETLLTPAFHTILKFLVDNNLHEQVTVGLTTNLAAWKQDVVDLLLKFKHVNLGMSAECLHPLNDYVRYGSNIEQTKILLDRWVALAQENQWYVQLRITPTILSVWHLDTVYDYAYRHSISIESCNFLHTPEFLRPSVLPKELREVAVNRLAVWIEKQGTVTAQTIINTRNPNFVSQQLLEDATSYINYLRAQPDESIRLPDLVMFLKKLEQNRKNSVLDYLPEYENVLRSAGY